MTHEFTGAAFLIDPDLVSTDAWGFFEHVIVEPQFTIPRVREWFPDWTDERISSVIHEVKRVILLMRN